MFDINLVPEIQKNRQKMAKRNAYATGIGLGLIGAIVLGIVILGSLKVAANISLTNTKERIAEVEAESVNYKDLEEDVLSLENGLKGISETLDGQNSWTLLFPHLESATPSDVQYTSLKIEDGMLTAQLKGRTVNSLARFIKSYNNYQVFVITGYGTPQSKIQISLDEKEIGETTVKSDGSWVFAVNADPTESHTIETQDGANSSRFVYNPKTGQFESEASGISIRIEHLFNNIDTKQFNKESGIVTFDASFGIMTGALW